jgi:hypothetical protein
MTSINPEDGVGRFNTARRMSMAKLQGETGDVANPFLGAEFWQPGTSVSGEVVRKFESANGLCYALSLSEPVSINGLETSDVALGNLTGLRMALQSAGVEELEVGDRIKLECTDLQPTTKGNDRLGNSPLSSAKSSS